LLPGIPGLAQELLITEFMTDNSKTLQDDYGEFPDWLELFNPGDSEVNLEGYYLTDKTDKLTKWKFPAVSLGAKRALIVFCSGKDRRDPASPLHTNFKLDNDGGDLLLIAPNGIKVISAYRGYPEQQADVSYGMATDSRLIQPILTDAPARVLVPPSADLGLRWTELAFDDASWKQGQTAVGFGVRSPELELLKTDVGTDMLGVNASLYIRIPFEVADPAAVDLLTLRVRYDDGFAAFLNGELVASASAPDDLQWNSTAKGNHSPRNFESFDLSGHVGALRAGQNVLAIQGLNVLASNSDLFILPELDMVDVVSLQPDVHLYLSTATPGAPNSQGLPQAAPKPKFSLAEGAYVDTQQVEISTALAGGVIRYTSDGTLPNESSNVYAGPLSITGPTRVTARVFKDGLFPGAPERNAYVIIAPSLVQFTSNVPLVICTTFGRTIGSNCGGGPYTPGYIIIVNPGADGKTLLSSPPHLANLAQFRKRGSSTCGNEKFAFNVEILDGEGRDKNVNIFDFPKESDYIMYAPNNFDRSLIRNPIAYWMSREVGRWAARTRNVECFFHRGPGPVTNQSYFGVYNFMEKNKPHPEKIDVAAMTNHDNAEPEVTGGYIFRRDRVGEAEVAINGGGYSSLVFVYPKLPTTAQRTYMTQFLNKTIGTLNPNLGRQEDNTLIDFTAWIDHHILNWYPKNVDAFRLSGYFFKDRDGPMVMGPVWDYDRTMGCSDDDRARNPEGWDNDNVGDGGTRYFEAGGLGSWYSLLFRNRPPIDDTPWNVAYRNRWRELRKGPLKTDHILGQIDEWADELHEPAERNFAKWTGMRPRFGSFQGEIDHLKDWLAQRADWIDEQFIETPRFSQPGGLVDKGTKVELLLTAEATIYYTIDGTDPRGTDDKPSASAAAYADPITIDKNTRILARALYPDGVWSAAADGKFVVELPKLMVTEIMYNPLPPTPEEDPLNKFTTVKMEFIEITNVGNEAIPLTGVRFVKGVTFNFKDGSVSKLEPGESVVAVRDKDAFAARYGADGIRVAGIFGGTLSDTGEAVNLLGPFDEVIFEFTYSSAWYPEANGKGASIENVDPSAPASGLGDPARWRPSSVLNGTPGKTGATVAGLQRPGDTNRDHAVNVIDTLTLIRLLFLGTGDAPCGNGGVETAGNKTLLDWDGNGELNVTDVIYSLRYIFQAGPPHIKGTACIAVDGCANVCAP
jgi:hypothetical protein